MRRWTLVVFAALVGTTLTLPAAAQWKWRDQGGHIQYSDTPPPPGVADKDILQRPGSSGPAGRTAPLAASAPASAASGGLVPTPRLAGPELEAKRKKAEQEDADKKKAEDAKVAAVKADNCARARAQMRTFDSGVRVARTNDKGEREFLDDKARAQEANRAREVVNSDCK